MLHPTHRSPDRAKGIRRTVGGFVCPYVPQKAARGVALVSSLTNAASRQNVQALVVIDPQRHIPEIPILVPVILRHCLILVAVGSDRPFLHTPKNAQGLAVSW